MSIRNLDALFDPGSVAVIGASERPLSVGAMVWRNMHGSGFAGRMFPLNPKYETLSGRRCYARVADLPETPELAVICTPPATVAPLARQLARRGTQAAVVLSAGLTDAQKQALLDAARPTLMRVLGPGGVGLLAPHAGLNASCAHLAARPGELAFISQSSSLATALLDWAEARRIGFSHFAVLGEQADVDCSDLLDYLASDARARAILLYMESADEARKFMSAARGAARNKPVIVVKAGRAAPGRRAAALHTGALATADEVMDAAIARAGMLRVDRLEELFLAAEILTRFKAPANPALTILTNGGGAGVLATDAAAGAGVPLAALSPALLADLDRTLPAQWSRGNPIDLGGDAPARRYVDALHALRRHPDDVGTLLFIHVPTALTPAGEIARAVLELDPPPGPPAPPLVSAWVGGPAVAEARALFMRAGIACYEMPEQAAAAIGMLQRHARNRAELTEAPPAASPLDTGAPDVERARALVRQALASGRELLTEPEAKAVCEAYRIPVAADASARAEGFGAPAMAHHPQRACELIVGAGIDPVFGPVILFGQGGVAGEAIRDRAVALPPLNAPLARALIGRTRVGRRLQSGPDAPPADLDAVVATLQAVSQLLADVPEVAELELNPLRVNRQGVIALGVRLRVSRQRPAGAAHFAIRPYPSELVETLDWRGQRLTLRPVRPEDEARHLAFFRSLDRESIRLRLFHSRRAIERSELARMVQIDYAREMAFVATTLDEDGRERTLGVARALADPENAGAEFGIVVRPDARGAGLGRILMDKLIGYQRAAGTGRLTATVLADNQRMRQLGHILGFADQPTPGDAAMRELTLPLQPASKPPARGMRETFARVFQPLALPWPKAEGD